MKSGFNVAAQGTIIYYGVYFGCFDTIKALVCDERRHLNFFTAWAIAQVLFVFL